MTKPQSYPFLAIAKRYGVDYGDVLLVADMWRHPANRSENEREADKRLFVACLKLPKQTVAKIERDISTANTEFRRIQAGEIDWLTGELNPLATCNDCGGSGWKGHGMGGDTCGRCNGKGKLKRKS
jgi:hypothetical protein